MANTTKTIAQLFGSSSTFSPRRSARSRIDLQEFSLPGIDGVFATVLGEHGTEIVGSGSMRSSAESTRAAAGTALNVLVEVVKALWRDGIVIDLFYDESTNLENLYDGSAAYTNLVIRDFTENGPRYFIYPTGSTFIAVGEFEITFLKLC